MFDQGWNVKTSIIDATFERYAGENVSFNSISC